MKKLFSLLCVMNLIALLFVQFSVFNYVNTQLKHPQTKEAPKQLTYKLPPLILEK